MAKLIVVEGPDEGSEFQLEETDGKATYTVGRDPQNEVPLQDSAVSRQHFRLESTGRGWRLADLGSRNQTFLNGRPVREAPLRHGDLLRAGDSELRLEEPGEPVESTGIASTIIKELPLELKRETLAGRLDHLEREILRDGPPNPRDALTKLLNFCGEIGSSRSAEDILEKLLEEIVPTLDADRGAVILREGNGWVARASHAAPSCPLGENGDRIHASTSIIEKVTREGKAVLSADTTTDEQFRKKESIVREEIVSVMAAPIRTAGRIVGALYADRRGRKDPFTEEELEFLVTAAGPMGHLFERLEDDEALRTENRNLYRSITGSKKIIGSSAAIRDVLEFIRKAAPTNMTVLIHGETGTGKELVASAIHYASPRKGHPFVAINCAALPENLIESELFGHERGAFTGAVTRRKGRFELADTGTVFLDEVGELSLTCQAKLLRLLEERTFERVGGVESVKTDVRIIAATNKSLSDAVADGSFREDLFYRLNVLNVTLAPLRERPADIPLLVEHFLRECGGRAKKLGKAAARKLASYPWPGNVRQLRNVIESAVVLGEGNEIRPDDLVLPEGRPPPTGRSGGHDADAWEPKSLNEIEKVHIQRVLEFTGGNKKRAAEILGIERCTLYAKIKGYAI